MNETKPSGLGDASTRDRLDQIRVPDDPAARPFIMQFLAVGVLLGLMVSGMYVFVDPHDRFPQDDYRPLIVDWTDSKINRLRDQDEAPRTVILGSSRAMAISPDHVEHTGFGPAPAFSLAIPSSTSRDFVLLYEYLVAEDMRPDHLVVAIDLDVRSTIGSVVEDSAAAPQLAGRDPDLIDDLRRLGNAFSLAGLVDTWRVLYYTHVAQYPPERMTLEEDGETTFPAVEHARATGTLDLQRAIEEHLRKQVVGYYATSNPSAAYAAHVEALVAQAEADGTQVSLFIPPVHPTLKQWLDTRISWLPAYEQAQLERLGQLCSDNVAVYDFRDVEAFGGEPDDFFDGWHYLHENGRRMVSAMAADIGSVCPGR